MKNCFVNSMRFLSVFCALFLTTSCESFKKSSIRPSDSLCAPIAREKCDALLDPVKEDAVKTATIYALQYRYCALKHEILIECDEQK